VSLASARDKRTGAHNDAFGDRRATFYTQPLNSG
jgi:hypothetical protein